MFHLPFNSSVNCFSHPYFKACLEALTYTLQEIESYKIHVRSTNGLEPNKFSYLINGVRYPQWESEEE